MVYIYNKLQVTKKNKFYESLQVIFIKILSVYKDIKLFSQFPNKVHFIHKNVTISVIFSLR